MNDVNSNSNSSLPKQNKLNVSKIAAAAGGVVYDEEADPLNAPEVLEAVAMFKKRLEQKGVAQKRNEKKSCIIVWNKKLPTSLDGIHIQHN